MKVSELLEQRRLNWMELERLCSKMQNKGKRSLGAPNIVRFATLYRAACADLALADAYQLPPNTVQYLHQLVGQAHNQLYRSKKYQLLRWLEILFLDTPQQIMRDRCVQFVFFLFWGLFIGSAWLSYNDSQWPGFAEEILGEGQIASMQAMFEDFDERPWEVNMTMTSFYIFNNAGIGLQCFASSVLILPGLAIIAQNAVVLGGSFGVMFRPDMGDAGANFRNFVTAHGPFELGAIVLSGAAGLRIGISWLATNGMTRTGALKQAVWRALPIALLAVLLFSMAAFIEGFISPSAWLPWEIKACIALISSTLMTFYFVVLGFPRRIDDAV
jgi:uncharacterized membrane protein SpoIIM required for sporulation